MKKLLLIVLLFVWILSSGIASIDAVTYTIVTPESVSEYEGTYFAVPISEIGAYNVVDDSFSLESTIGEYVFIAPVKP